MITGPRMITEPRRAQANQRVHNPHAPNYRNGPTLSFPDASPTTVTVSHLRDNVVHGPEREDAGVVHQDVNVAVSLIGVRSHDLESGRPMPAKSCSARPGSLIVQHDRAVALLAGPDAPAAVLRIGVPLEFPADVLPTAFAKLASSHPHTRLDIRHSASAAQVLALRSGDLDLGLVRDRPHDPALDAVLAVDEAIGVVLSDAVQRRAAGHH